MREPTRFSLRDGQELAGIGLDELWCRYVSVGGTLGAAAVARCLALDVDQCDPHEHDLIAQALNETFLDLDIDTFPVLYASDGSPHAACAEVFQTTPVSRSVQARRQAALARLRSSAAARQSADLHAVASELMRSSGQLQFAARATARAHAARGRAVASFAD